MIVDNDNPLSMEFFALRHSRLFRSCGNSHWDDWDLTFKCKSMGYEDQASFIYLIIRHIILLKSQDFLHFLVCISSPSLHLHLLVAKQIKAEQSLSLFFFSSPCYLLFQFQFLMYQLLNQH